jgi:TonB family protein
VLLMLGLAMAMLLQAGAAEGPSGPASEMHPAIVEPDWQRFPTVEDMAKYYPKAALKEDLAGRAVISCMVTLEGRLADCRATAAWPEGAGFGEAAVAMSEVFRMRPQTKGGKPVAGGRVTIPLEFLMDANLRSAPISARHPDVKAEIVELDCRFRDQRLDNCLVRGASTEKAVEVALKAAEEVRLSSLPTKRRQGRILVPLVFKDASGGISAPEMVTRPIWRDRPTLHDVYRAYPQAARQTSVVGDVVVECQMEARGSLAGCFVASEMPSGQGFGAAALTLMPTFKAEPVDALGLKVDGRKIRVPIRFSPAAPPTREAGE